MIPAKSGEYAFVLKLLDQGLDEMAAGTRATFAPRIAALIAVGLISLAFLPWTVCAAWVVFAGGVDTFSWFATREQAAGGPVSLRARLSHVFSLVVGVAAWVLLSTLFWRTGTAAGAVSAVV